MARKNRINKIVIAPDSFKESLTAMEAARAIERGMRRVFPDAEIFKVPMADGGEGTVQAMVDATNGKRLAKTVTGPMGEPVRGFIGLTGDGKTAIIEMAAAAGLHLVPAGQRNPLATTTYGVGELIDFAIEQGARRIIIGLGGSATNDGGCGMAQALGARLLDKKGGPIGFGGGALAGLDRIEITALHSKLKDVQFEIAADVTNPLTGDNGASVVFGPQKGAGPVDIKILDDNLRRFARIVRRDLHREVDTVQGAGAAGGMGAGALCFLGGNLRRGADIVIEAVSLQDSLAGADFVITGEGKVDGQTSYGKAPIAVARCAKKAGIPVIALAGIVADGYSAVFDHGIDAVFPIVRGPVSLPEALRQAANNLARTAENVARLVKMGI